tara:strand:+ start:1462 stop:1821 length:360 start_codon:yes stop_codon:yes gene_type:complete
MAKLLFRLRNVPEDEAQDVRELLDSNDISYFETSAGNWGISLPAIWTNESEKFNFARELIDEYQTERTIRLRKEYQLSKARGEAKTLRHSFRDNPIKFIAFSAIIFLVLYLSLQIYFFF